MHDRSALVRCTFLIVGAALLALASGLAHADPGQPQPGQATARPASGKDLYAVHCATCHGGKGEGTAMGRPLTGDKAHGDAEADIRAVIRDGIPDSPMTGFGEKLTDAELTAVTKHVVSLSRR